MAGLGMLRTTVRLVVLCLAIICLAAVNWQAAVHAQATDQGFATFCILNASGWTVFQSNLTVTDNGEVLASVARNQYVFKRVAPGRHVLKLETGRELVIQAAAGETYYIKYAYNPAIIALLSSVTFTQIPKDQAEKVLVQMTPADEQSAAQAPAPAARIFVASLGNDQIVRIDDMTGAGWTSFGSRGGGANEFLGPTGIFVDAVRKIFVTDSNNHRIVRMTDMTGVSWTTFGSRGSGTNQFDSPRGIFVDAAGKIFVTDSNNHRIVRIDDMTGAGWITFGSFGDGANQFLGPVGIFVDARGKIFVTDAGNRRIVRMNDVTGAGWTTFGTAGSGSGQFIDPNGIFVSSAGQISVTDSGNNRIVRMDNMTESGWATFGRLSSNGKSRLISPAGIFLR